MKIYVASSWQNSHQPAVVTILRGMGHQVYDFRNPEPGNTGFHWSEIDPDWESWSPIQYRSALNHPLAERGHASDMAALESCEACLLVLPSGRSASWEFGYACGKGKRGAVFMPEPCAPELMYRGYEIMVSFNGLDIWGRTLAREEPTVVESHP